MASNLSAREFASALRDSAASLQSLRWGLKATLARSFGIHLVAMVSCGFSLGFGRVALLEHSRSSLRVQELESNIGKEYEPRRDERYPALNAALLGPLSTWSICDSIRAEQPSIARQARNLVRVVDQSAEHFADSYLGLQGSRQYPELSRILPLDVDRSEIGSPASCDSLRDAARANMHIDWPEVSLFVPSYTTAWARIASQFVGCEGVVDLFRSPPSGSASYLDGIYRDIRAAVVSMRSLDGLSVRATGNAGPREARLNSIYFISYTGYMVTSPRENSGSIDSIDWLGGDYVRRATQIGSHPDDSEWQSRHRQSHGCQSSLSAFGRARHMSHAYLDIFGSGAVTTHCYPVGASVDQGRDRRVGGVFCVDIGLPRSLVHEHLLRQSTFAVGILRGRPESLRDADVDSRYYCDRPSCIPVQSGVEPQIGGAGLRAIPWDEARAVFLEFIRGERRDNSQVSSIVVGGIEYQVARVWRTHDSENERRTDWVVLRAPPKNDALFFGSLAVALFFAAGGAAAVAFRQTLDSHARDWGPIRRLDAGFLVADENDQLLRANDRCEEILNRKLPIVGTDPLYWSGFQPGRIDANDYFTTPDPGAPVKRSALALLDVNRDCLVIVGFVELMERRRRGLRDVYLFELEFLAPMEMAGLV